MDLHVLERGPADAPPVVLLHALSKSGADWNAVADALAADHRVLAPDLRGHGSSPWAERYSFGLMRDDVVELLEPIGPATLVGHSMGGTVAYHVIQDRPDLVTRLIIEDTPPPKAMEMEPPPDEPPFPVEFDWQALVQLSREFAHPDPVLWERLVDIAVPTLVVAGGEESDVPQDDLAAVAERIPGARLTVVGGGHFVHETRPDEFISVVRAFLDATDGDAS